MLRLYPLTDQKAITQAFDTLALRLTSGAVPQKHAVRWRPGGASQFVNWRSGEQM